MRRQPPDQEALIEHLQGLPLFRDVSVHRLWSIGRRIAKDVFNQNYVLALECIKGDDDYFQTLRTQADFFRACYGAWRSVRISGEAESRANKQDATTTEFDGILKVIPK